MARPGLGRRPASRRLLGSADRVQILRMDRNGRSAGVWSGDNCFLRARAAAARRPSAPRARRRRAPSRCARCSATHAARNTRSGPRGRPDAVFTVRTTPPDETTSRRLKSRLRRHLFCRAGVNGHVRLECRRVPLGCCRSAQAERKDQDVKSAMAGSPRIRRAAGRDRA